MEEDEEVILNFSSEEILVQNLKLMGYEKAGEEHGYIVKLEMGMFRKTNSMAMESILYFLLQ